VLYSCAADAARPEGQTQAIGFRRSVRPSIRPHSSGCSYQFTEEQDVLGPHGRVGVVIANVQIENVHGRAVVRLARAQV